MAALSALLPIVNIEKSQQSPSKHDGISASKQKSEQPQSVENKRSADEKEQGGKERKSSEFGLMYQEDVRAYGDAEPLDKQQLTPLAEAEIVPLNADDPIQSDLGEGSILPLTGENLPLTEVPTEEPENTSPPVLGSQLATQDPSPAASDMPDTVLLTTAEAGVDSEQAQTLAQAQAQAQVQPHAQAVTETPDAGHGHVSDTTTATATATDTATAADLAKPGLDTPDTNRLSNTAPDVSKSEISLAETSATEDANRNSNATVSVVGEMRRSEANAETSSLAQLDAKRDAAANDTVGQPVAVTQKQLTAEADSLTSKPEVASWQKEQADIVRSWRGIAPREGAGLQTSAQDFSKPMQQLGQQGQLQQFAESLRGPQVATEALTLTPDKALNTSAATTASAESVTAWRQESAQPSSSLQGRLGQNTPFAQTLGAQSFNSKLGQTFGTNAWAESVSQRVTLMTAQRLGSATIELDPPELGAMTVKVSLEGDKASVSFMSANSHVREALEQSFPRLQEMLGQQGLQLADAQVSDNPSTGQNSGDSRSASGQSSSKGTEELQGESTEHSVNVPTGLIDYYA